MFGNYMEFNPERQFAMGYSAPCGKDTQIFRDTGTWMAPPRKGTVLCTVNGALARYKLLEITKEKLVMVRFPGKA